MALKQLYGDRDLNGDILKNYSFTTFADLAAANLVVGSVFGFAYMVNPGALYYNQTGLAWQSVGGKGVKGDTGIPGSTVLSGSGAPINDPAGTGVNGDFYIDITGVDIYGPKTAGVWGSPTSLVGSQGSPGSPGANGKTILNGVTAPPALTGTNGDFFLNTASMEMYGPKAGGVWPAGVSLIGPPGPTGAQGVAGTSGPPGTATGLDASYGPPSNRTTTTAGVPTLPPTLLSGNRYNFDTTNRIMYRWNGTLWVVTTASYLDLGFKKFYSQDATQTDGWVFGTDLSASPAITPIITSTGAYTPTDFVSLAPVDSTAAAITITLQTTPYEGQIVEIKDIKGTAELHPITITAHGTTKLDDVTAGSFVIDRAYGSVRLIYRTCNTDPVTTSVVGWWVLSVAHPKANTAVTVNSGPTALTAKRDQTILYDVSGAGFGLTLPVSPREGDRVCLKEKTGSTNALALTGTYDGTVNPTFTTAYLVTVVEYHGGAWRKMN